MYVVCYIMLCKWSCSIVRTAQVHGSPSSSSYTATSCSSPDRHWHLIDEPKVVHAHHDHHDEKEEEEEKSEIEVGHHFVPTCHLSLYVIRINISYLVQEVNL